MFILDIQDREYRHPYLYIDYDGTTLTLKIYGYSIDEPKKFLIDGINVDIEPEELDAMGECLRREVDYWSNGYLTYTISSGVVTIDFSSTRLRIHVDSYTLGDSIRDHLNYLRV